MTRVRDWHGGPPPTIRQERARAWLALPGRESMTQAEAAEALGCSVTALKSALTRARRDGVIPPDTKLPPGPGVGPVREEWEHLRSLGVSSHDAARRLGVTAKYLDSLPH